MGDGDDRFFAVDALDLDCLCCTRLLGCTLQNDCGDGVGTVFVHLKVIDVALFQQVDRLLFACRRDAHLQFLCAGHIGIHLCLDDFALGKGVVQRCDGNDRFFHCRRRCRSGCADHHLLRFASIACLIHSGDGVVDIFLCNKGVGAVSVLLNCFSIDLHSGSCIVRRNHKDVADSRNRIVCLEGNGRSLCCDGSQGWRALIHTNSQRHLCFVARCITCGDFIADCAFFIGNKLVNVGAANVFYAESLSCTLYLYLYALHADVVSDGQANQLIFFVPCRTIDAVFFCHSDDWRLCIGLGAAFEIYLILVVDIACVVGDQDGVAALFVCYETVFSVAAGCQCGGDVIAAHRYRLDTGKSICHLEGQCIVFCIDCFDCRHGFVDAHSVDTGRLAGARAAVGKEVIVSLIFIFYGQCSVGQLLAISPRSRFFIWHLCRTVIGINLSAAAVAGQGKGHILIGPAAVWIALAACVDIDGRSRDAAAVYIHPKADLGIIISSAGAGHRHFGGSCTHCLQNDGVVPAGAYLDHAAVGGGNINRTGIGAHVDDSFAASAENLVVDAADVHGIPVASAFTSAAAAAVSINSHLEGSALGGIARAESGHLDGGGAGFDGAHLQLEAVCGHLCYVAVGVGQLDAAGVGVDADVAHTAFLHFLVRDARQLQFAAGGILDHNLKGNGPAGVTRAGGGHLDGRSARFYSGHGDVALGIGIGHLCHAGIAGRNLQRAAVVVDAHDLLFPDVQILVGDAVQRHLFVGAARAGTGAGIGTSAWRCASSGSFYIQRSCIVVDPIAVAVQTVDLSIAVQLGRRIGVSIVDDGIVVIHHLTGGNGFELVELEVAQGQGGSLRRVDCHIGKAAAAAVQSAFLQDGAAFDADGGQLGVARSKHPRGLLAVYHQRSCIDVVQFDPIGAAVDVQRSFDVHIF